MAQNIQLEVVTPTGVAVRAETDQVEAPSVFGEFGVLPGHLPLLAALRAGVVRFRSAGKITAVAVGPGFAEAGPDKVTVLTDIAVEGTAVNAEQVRVERDAIEQKLGAFNGGEGTGAEYEELVRQRDWLNAQLDAAKESGASA
jgi:F-type H+-transporting ATPase subunit epsilon